MNTLLNTEQVRTNISIVRFLQCLGFNPVKRVGSDLFYVSMLTESDMKFSFVVNEEHNSWYDHGWGVGGDIIEFIRFFWKPISHQDALLKIHATLTLPGSENLVNIPGMQNPVENQVTKGYELIAVNEVGTTEALNIYIQSQYLRPAAKGALKEIFFKKSSHFNTGEHESKILFGIGWPNECGGWEIRNKYFRTCIGHKGITFIPGKKDSVAVFSDYFSFLVWKGGLLMVKDESAIVLNHHELIHAGLALARKFGKIELYFDRSQAGFKATRTFIRQFPGSIDRSRDYSSYLNLHRRVVADLQEDSAKSKAGSHVASIKP